MYLSPKYYEDDDVLASSSLQTLPFTTMTEMMTCSQDASKPGERTHS